jgi:hypothetical protein
VAELAQLKVEALVSPHRPTIRAAKQATKTIPIVMVTNGDPVAEGFVDSLARPGGNITGLTRLTRELSGKRLELLTEVVPRLSRVGVLWNSDEQTASSGVFFKEYETAARALKIELQPGLKGQTLLRVLGHAKTSTCAFSFFPGNFKSVYWIEFENQRCKRVIVKATRK